MAAPSSLQPHLPTVLIVDDEAVMRSLLTRTMEAEHYRVYSASNGVEALSLLEKIASVDVVIADVSMPNMDGRQLAMELSKRHDHIPVVLISGVYLGGGTDLLGPVLPKPFTPMALASRVREVLAQHDQLGRSHSTRVLPSELESLPPIA